MRFNLDERLAFSPNEMARVFGISDKIVRNALQEGEIEARNVGRRVVIGRDAAERWFKSRPPYTPRANVKAA